MGTFPSQLSSARRRETVFAGAFHSTFVIDGVVPSGVSFFAIRVSLSVSAYTLDRVSRPLGIVESTVSGTYDPGGTGGGGSSSPLPYTSSMVCTSPSSTLTDPRLVLLPRLEREDRRAEPGIDSVEKTF